LEGPTYIGGMSLYGKTRAIRNPSTSIKASFISIFIDTKASAKRQTNRSSDKEEWLGIRVVT